MKKIGVWLEIEKFACKRVRFWAIKTQQNWKRPWRPPQFTLFVASVVIEGLQLGHVPFLKKPRARNRVPHEGPLLILAGSIFRAPPNHFCLVRGPKTGSPLASKVDPSRRPSFGPQIARRMKAHARATCHLKLQQKHMGRARKYSSLFLLRVLSLKGYNLDMFRFWKNQGPETGSLTRAHFWF